jgi:hypothetical protein
MTVPPAGYRARSMMLGNSIVPACARLALYRLYSCFAIKSIEDANRHAGKRLAYSKGVGIDVRFEDAPPHASYCGGVLQSFEVRDTHVNRMAILVNPDHYRSKDASKRGTNLGFGKGRLSDVVTQPFVINQWPTARGQTATTSHILTERTSRDLHTLARFAKSIGGERQPLTSRGTWLNIAYIEVMFGFAKGHTEYLTFTRAA